MITEAQGPLSTDDDSFRPKPRHASIHRLIREAAHQARERGHFCHWTIHEAPHTRTASATCCRCGLHLSVMPESVPAISGSALGFDCGEA